MRSQKVDVNLHQNHCKQCVRLEDNNITGYQVRHKTKKSNFRGTCDLVK